MLGENLCSQRQWFGIAGHKITEHKGVTWCSIVVESFFYLIRDSGKIAQVGRREGENCIILCYATVCLLPR